MRFVKVRLKLPSVRIFSNIRVEFPHFWNLPFRVSRSLVYLNYLSEILKDKFREMIKNEEIL